MNNETREILEREINKACQELTNQISELKKINEMPKIYEEQAKQAELNKALANMHTPAQGTQNTGLNVSYYEQFI